MRWMVKGADEQTGEDLTREIEADTAAQAQRRARRAGILWESIQPVVAPSPSVMPARMRQWPLRNMRLWSAPWKWIATATAALLAGIGLLAVLALGSGYFAARQANSADSMTLSPPAGPTPVPVDTAEPESAIDLRIRRFRYELNGREHSAAYEIRNNSLHPIVIHDVLYNAESSAEVATEGASSYYLDGVKKWPVKLTVGESVLAFHRNQIGVPLTGYQKDVLFMVVMTDKGVEVYGFDE